MYRILMIAFVLIPVAVWSQCRLAGTVTEQDGGNPLPGAHIVLENTLLTSVADPTGSFVFTSLKKGNYSLRVSHVGFETILLTVDLDSDTAIRIVLPEAPVLGEEVNITATRAGEKYPVAYTTMTQKEISKVNTGRDLPYIMQYLPSVVSTSDAGTGIGYTGMTIRGTDLTRINVTVNGIPLNDAESQGVWFVDLPDLATSAADIQVQRGVGTSTNGAGAFGATMNIQTSGHRDQAYGELSFSGGSYGTIRGSLNFGTGIFGKNFSVDGRFSILSSDGYIDRASADLHSWYLSAGYYGPRTTLRLITFSGSEKTYQAWEGVPGDSLASNRTFNPAGMYLDSAGNVHYYPDQTDNYKQDHYQLIFSRELSKKTNLNVALFYTKGFGYYENYKMAQSFAEYGLPDVILGGDTIRHTDLVNRKYLDNDFYGGTFSLNYKLEKKLDLTFGGGWNRYLGNHYGRIIWAQYASTGNNERDWYNSTGDKTDLNLYAKAVYTVFGKLSLFADLQYRHVGYVMAGTLDDLRTLDQSHWFNFFNPKAGIWYDFSDHHHAFFSFGIANREPSRNNYKDADPGRIPTPETLYDYELGYAFSNHRFQAGVNLYYMNYRDQLVLTGEINSVGEAIMVNVPKSYRAGIELNAGIRILRSLRWDLNATFSRNRIRSFTSYTDEYDAEWNYLGQQATYLGETHLSFSPSVNLNSIIRFMPLRGLTFSFTSKYVGRQYIDNTSSQSRSIDPWFISNLGVEYILSAGFFKEIGFSLTAGNLFNATYETNAWVYPYILDGDAQEMTGWFPQSPINLMAGVTIRL